MTISSPATTRLDLPVDLHTFTDDLVWGYLDDARDPDQVVEGAELWGGKPPTRRPRPSRATHRRALRDHRHPAPTRLTPARRATGKARATERTLDHPIGAGATHPAPGDTNLPITPGTGRY